jgi:hypothetical protein
MHKFRTVDNPISPAKISHPVELSIIDTVSDISRILPKDRHPQLSNILDNHKDYIVLASGSNVLFVVEKKAVDIGETFGDVYRFTLMRDDATIHSDAEADGVYTALINENRFHVRRELTHRIFPSKDERLWDINNNEQSIESCTFILDKSSKDFRIEYITDMILHGLIHIGGDNLAEKFGALLQEVSPDADMHIANVGYGGLADIEGRHTDHKYIFTITACKAFRDEGQTYPSTTIISRSIRNFLDDAGIGYWYDEKISPLNPKTEKIKSEERAFQEKNQPKIARCLQDDGLLRALVFAYSNMDFRNLRQSAEPCEHCHKPYIAGEISLGEKMGIIECENLHILQSHPETFVNRICRLRNIAELLQECNGEDYESRKYDYHADIKLQTKGMARELKDLQQLTERTMKNNRLKNGKYHG